MKTSRWIILILVLCVILSACSVQKTKEDTASNQDGVHTLEDYMPLFFNDESQFIETIASVAEAKKEANKNIDTIEIDSKRVGTQEYSTRNDKCRLESVTKYYKPSRPLKGMSFSEIAVKQEYISFYFDIESQGEKATFAWLREMSPEVAMNDLYGRGAISERELEYNGIKYVFLEWSDPEAGKSDGYSIHWVVNNMAYQASIPAGYTDEGMLEFCQMECCQVGK